MASAQLNQKKMADELRKSSDKAETLKNKRPVTPTPSPSVVFGGAVDGKRQKVQEGEKRTGAKGSVEKKQKEMEAQKEVQENEEEEEIDQSQEFDQAYYEGSDDDPNDEPAEKDPGQTCDVSVFYLYITNLQ